MRIPQHSLQGESCPQVQLLCKPFWEVQFQGATQKSPAQLCLRGFGGFAQSRISEQSQIWILYWGWDLVFCRNPHFFPSPINPNQKILRKSNGTSLKKDLCLAPESSLPQASVHVLEMHPLPASAELLQLWLQLENQIFERHSTLFKKHLETSKGLQMCFHTVMLSWCLHFVRGEEELRQASTLHASKNNITVLLRYLQTGRCYECPSNCLIDQLCLYMGRTWKCLSWIIHHINYIPIQSRITK